MPGHCAIPVHQVRNPYFYAVKADYIIIGQGIAGSVLALSLHKRGRKVVVLSKEQLSSSSAVAAGVYNPFNFRRSIPTWQARIACPMAATFYREAEQLLGAKFHETKKIIRVFGDAAEQQRWNEFLTGDDVVFASTERADTQLEKNIRGPYGYGVLNGGGVINTGSFLFAVKEFFRARNEYRDEEFIPELLEIRNEDVVYDERIAAKQVIFCEGHLAANNRFFPDLPIAPSKGEVLHVSIPGLDLKDVMNGAVYLAPLGNELYVCGATFNPGIADESITIKAREELQRKLESMISLPFRIESQFAGVRPAGRDRKPLLGRSRQFQNVAIFNGMGSKGVMLSPYLAQLLVNHLESGVELPREISLQRFKPAL